MSILQLNDWPIKKFIVALFVVILTIFVVLGMYLSGINVPILTGIIGFISAIFIPGFIILRILKLHQLGTTKSVLFAAGLGVAFLMLVGLVINSVYPLLGIHRPLDKLPTVITFTATLIILCVIAFLRDRRYSPPEKVTPSNIPHRVWFLLLLPVMATAGAELVNLSQNNLLLMALMVLLAAVPVLAVIFKWIPEKMYPEAIISTALALLLHRALISNYLWGSDIIGEFACWRTVFLNGIWSSNSTNLVPSYNTSLGVTILPQMLSNLLGIDGLWVFKLVFPLLLTFVPMAMFEMLRKQFSVKTTFLAVFMVMSLYSFYTTFIDTGKQEIATVFLALFMLIMVDKDLRPSIKNSLLIAFGFGAILTHYSTAFMLIAMVVLAAAILFVLRRKHNSFSLGVVTALVALTLSWYWFNADGAVIKQFVNWGNTAVTIPVADSAIPDLAMESHRLIAQGSPNMPSSLRYLYLFTQFFIAAGAFFGIIRWLFRRDENICNEFMAFAILFVGLLGLELILPQLSLMISLDRIYLVCLLVLAPFGITGAIELINILKGLRQRGLTIKNRLLSPIQSEHKVIFGISAVFLAVFLLANTGFLYELAGQPLANSFALSGEKADFPIFNQDEFASAKWLLENKDPAAKLYYDSTGFQLFTYVDAAGYMTGKTSGQILYRHKDSNAAIATDVPAHSYIYLRSYNVDTGRLTLGWPAYQTMDMKQIDMSSLGAFSEVLKSSMVVFDNGKSRILYTETAFSAEKGIAKNERR